MFVTISGPGDSVSFDTDASVVGVATVTRTVGGVDLWIDRDGPVWNDDIIDDAGGMLVTIDPGLGRQFRFVSDVPRWGERGATLPLMAPETWLGIRNVGVGMEFRSVAAGTIARFAVMTGMLGIGSLPITIASTIHSAPHVDEYVFDGQTVYQVMVDLNELTGQEWFIDDRFQFRWVARQGRYREELGIVVDADGGMEVGGSQSLDDIAREVIEIQPDGRIWRVFNHRTPALWPRQETVSP